MSNPPPFRNSIEEDSLAYPLPGVEQRVGERIHRGVGAIERSLNSTLKQLGSVAPAAGINTQGAIDWAQRVLPIWAPKLLTNLALELAQAGQEPGAPIRSPIELVEQEVARRSRKGRGELSDLMELLNSFTPMSQTAGWLTLQEGGAPRFAQADLPALLVGQALGGDAALTQKLRPSIGADSGWAEAAWAAVAQGDPLEPWLALLLGETEPLRLRERLIVTCHALGGLMPGQPPGEHFAEAYHVCLAALFWLLPSRSKPAAPTPRAEPKNPWALTPQIWQRCVLALAHAGRVGAEHLAAVSTRRPALWREPPRLLGRMIEALGWSCRLDDASQSAILALCLPDVAGQEGGLGSSFWQTVSNASTAVGSRVRQILLPWLRAFAIPTMVEHLRPEYRRLLGFPSLGGPALYLIDAEIPLWYEAWSQLLKSETAKDCITAWIDVACQRANYPASDESQDLIFEAAPALLTELGLAANMREALRSGLRWYLYPESEQWAARVDLYWRRLIELAAPEAADWERWIAESHGSRMPLDLWLAAGAPVELAVRSIVAYLRELGGNPDTAEQARAVLGRLAQTDHPQKLGKVLAEILAQPGDAARCQFESWPAGAWLSWLLHPKAELKDELDPAVRRRALQYLATYSVHPEVRGQSVEALLVDNPDARGQGRDV